MRRRSPPAVPGPLRFAHTLSDDIQSQGRRLSCRYHSAARHLDVWLSGPGRRFAGCRASANCNRGSSDQRKPHARWVGGADPVACPRCSEGTRVAERKHRLGFMKPNENCTPQPFKHSSWKPRVGRTARPANKSKVSGRKPSSRRGQTYRFGQISGPTSDARNAGFERRLNLTCVKWRSGPKPAPRQRQPAKIAK